MTRERHDIGSSKQRQDDGYIMVVLLVSMAVAAIWMSAALPAWRQQSMREKELELIFRGEQYARAIALYQIKNNSYPLDIDVLISQRYLRKKWKDPVTGEDFQPVGITTPGTGTTPGASGTSSTVPPIRGGVSSPAGRTGAPQQPAPSGGLPSRSSLSNQPLLGGITGVRSLSQATSIRVYNGQQQHNLWQFDGAMMMARMGRNRAPQGGAPGRGGDGRQAPGGRQGAGPGRANPPGGVSGGRGGMPPPPPPPPAPPGRGAGS
jgi:type II secretory pathway pseudopilin PulG